MLGIGQRGTFILRKRWSPRHFSDFWLQASIFQLFKHHGLLILHLVLKFAFESWPLSTCNLFKICIRLLIKLFYCLMWWRIGSRIFQVCSRARQRRKLAPIVLIIIIIILHIGFNYKTLLFRLMSPLDLLLQCMIVLLIRDLNRYFMSI